MFDLGLERFHLRKPTFKQDDYLQWLGQIDQKYHDRIVIHTDDMLESGLNIRGIHATQRSELSQENYVSKSCHSIEEIMQWQVVEDYLFLSPIFDSISKEDYPSSFELDALQEQLNTYQGKPIIALGGIDKDKVALCRMAGFQGVAVLGAIWKAEDPIASFKELQNKCQA